ncbi:MAG: hypothetical protein HYW23_03135 [Candidatus Aenigmarchaeota archaeon]|nr:hypothetical protein [Candidatus Aenigmarchaeota archaeon]
MPEEKIVTINLRREFKKTPVWRRQMVFCKLVKKELKDEKIKISQKMNEKIWAIKTPKIRVKVIKDDKSTRAELVE